MARKLNIKSLAPKNTNYRQGYYKPANPEKYLGDLNKIIFRSAWERKFAVYCDSEPKVLAWSSEPVAVPYFHPVLKTMKPYYVDFYMKTLQDDNSTKEFIVEVKPSKKLIAPMLPEGRVTQKRADAFKKQAEEYMINLHKFDAAKKYAESRGWSFILVTERFHF